jgi:hypothetical protein
MKEIRKQKIRKETAQKKRKKERGHPTWADPGPKPTEPAQERNRTGIPSSSLPRCQVDPTYRLRLPPPADFSPSPWKRKTSPKLLRAFTSRVKCHQGLSYKTPRSPLLFPLSSPPNRAPRLPKWFAGVCSSRHCKSSIPTR